MIPTQRTTSPDDEPVLPVDPRVVSADNALVEIARTRRGVLVPATNRLGRMLVALAAAVDVAHGSEAS